MRVTGVISEEMLAQVQGFAKEEGISQQDWIGKAIEAQVLLSGKFRQAVVLARKTARTQGVHPHEFMAEALRAYVERQLMTPSVEDLVFEAIADDDPDAGSQDDTIFFY